MANIEKTIREGFPGKTIIIVGDLVADQFLNGTIARVSREAPVFILRHNETTTRPGAAANAAANVASLGGNPVLIGFLGQDLNGEILKSALAESGVDGDGIVLADGLITTTKIRVLAGQHYAGRQQVIRIDYENTCEISEENRKALRERFASAANSADAIIVSDYNYGSVFEEIFEDA